MKAARKVFLYFLLAVGLVFTALTISVVVFKDRIIQQFINEANKSLSTPVKIGKIEVSAWRDFPNLSIVFHNVYVEDSYPQKQPLLEAETISFSLNTWEVWQGKYSIRRLEIDNSTTDLRVDTKGKSNYVIVKKSTNGNGATLSFDLNNIRLKNAIVSYRDDGAVQHHQFKADKLEASVSVAGALYNIRATGDVTTEQIKIQRDVFLAGKRFDVNASIVYHDANKQIVINKSSVAVNRSRFEVQGSYAFSDKNLIDISADGTEANIQTIINLFPENVVQRLRAYESDGDVYFSLDLKGEISTRHSPALSVKFGWRNATVFHPEYNTRITHADLTGSFQTPSLKRFNSATLQLRDVQGELNGKPFEANLDIKNFDNPYVDFAFKGDVDAAALKTFFSMPQVEGLAGSIDADVAMKGELGMLKRRATAQQVSTNGSITLRDVSFIYGSSKTPVSSLNGVLQFNNNDLALSGVTGQLGRSDFRLNGFFKNIITFLLFENQPVGIETDLTANFIDLDELFAIGFGQAASGQYSFSISPQINLNFNCNVGYLRFKRFHPMRVKGDLLVKNQMAVSRNISFNALGGTMSLNGIVDAKNPDAIDVVSAFQWNGVHLDSVFNVFENFKQSFIEDQNLKGKVTADVALEVTLNQNLSAKPETLIADISTTIKGGGLNNFEPMQKLNRYLDENDLSRLRFADLKNDIHIEQKTIYIPQMEIRSNATTIQLSGTHTFDQHIDYRVAAPFRNRKRIDPDEIFGAVEDDGKGPMKIYLKITGTTEQYNVSLDKQAVKQKIASDIRREVQELKEAFKTKGKKKKKELELKEDDYFDWDENN